MARANKKAPRGRTSTRSSSRKTAAPAVAEVEVVEDVKGMGMEDGIVIVTTLVLIAAILMVDYHLGSYFDAGKLF